MVDGMFFIAFSQDLFDKDFFLNKCGHNFHIAVKIIDNFLGEYPKSLLSIRNALEKKDADELKISAHSFKGMISYFSSYLAAQALILQNIGISGDLSKAFHVFNEMEKNVEQLIKNLKAFVEELGI